MSKNNILNYFGRKALKSSKPVELEDYRRAFNTKVTVRSSKGKNKAILNAKNNRDYSMNGIKIEFTNFEDFGRYAFREDGYRFRMVREFIDGKLRTDRKILMPVDRVTSDKDILPYNKYLKSCINSSKEWGSDFYEQFIETTYLMDGRRLSNYLDDLNIS